MFLFQDDFAVEEDEDDDIRDNLCPRSLKIERCGPSMQKWRVLTSRIFYRGMQNTMGYIDTLFPEKSFKKEPIFSKSFLEIVIVSNTLFFKQLKKKILLNI